MMITSTSRSSLVSNKFLSNYSSCLHNLPEISKFFYDLGHEEYCNPIIKRGPISQTSRTSHKIQRPGYAAPHNTFAAEVAENAVWLFTTRFSSNSSMLESKTKPLYNIGRNGRLSVDTAHRTSKFRLFL